ncbi:MAG: class A beta-lactamase-related serine hydrolase, partial [Anaerolineae bacterium]|nr:class A beta-lactamase-related serine hydrolase [Anaerolineae bacterium]
FDPSDTQAGFYHNADQAYPLASTFKIVLLLGYAEQVEAGSLDPDEVIPFEALELYYLPGTDGGAHPEFLKSLGAGRATMTLSEVVDGMMTYSSNAAADYIESRLRGLADWDELYLRLGLEQTSKPHSYLGLYLYITNHETGAYDLESLGAEATLAEQIRLEQLFVTDDSWRETELRYVANFTNQAQLDVQRDVTANFGARASANDLARIMTAVYTDSDAISPRARELARHYLEWPMRLNPDNTKTFRILAAKNGAWPGVLTSAWYAEPLDADPRVLVVLYRNMPADFWDAWLASFSQQLLEVNVLTNANCTLYADALTPVVP